MVETRNLTQTFDPKINRGPPRVIDNICVKYHYMYSSSKDNRVIVQIPCKVKSPNVTLTFDLYSY